MDLHSLHRHWQALAGPHGADTADSLREYMTGVAMLMIVAGLAVCTLVILGGALAGVFDAFAVVMILVVDVPIALGVWLLLGGWWRLARFVPVTVFMALGAYGSSIAGLSTGFVLFYAVAIILAGLLFRRRAQWWLLVFSLLCYFGLGWARDPYQSWDRLAMAIPVVAGLVGISLLQWLSANQLAKMLDRARGSAAAWQAEAAERRQAEAEIRRQAGTMAALHETALDLATDRDLPGLLRAIIGRAAELLGAGGGVVRLYRPETDDLQIAETYNMGPRPGSPVLKRGEGLAGRVLETGRPEAVDDYSAWPERLRAYEPYDFNAMVVVPIRWADELVGVLGVVDRGARTFSAGDIRLLEQFAALAASALVHTRLVQDLNCRMQQLRDAQAQLVQSARLAAVGELAAGVAHELNNPLTPVLGLAELWLREPGLDPELRRDLSVVASEARRARDIIHSLLDFSRQAPSSRVPADVCRGVKEMLRLVRLRLNTRRIAIQESYATDLPPVLLDEGRMKQVWLNLFTNAMHAMPEGGRLSIVAERVDGRLAVRVADTGTGIEPDVLPRIFEPFFTTRPLGEGTGLGLSVSLGIVQEHGGTIEVESQVGRGSTFTVWLPV